MLYRLLTTTDRTSFDPCVFSLASAGSVAAKIQQLGVPVRALGMTRGVPNPLPLLRLAWLLREAKIDLVQTWMYHADLLGGLAAKLTSTPVVWGIHNSTLDRATTKLSTLWTVKACARLSGWVPDGIVCCAESSRRAHAAAGYCSERMTVILNGFDVTQLKPDAGARRSVREELHLPADTKLIGLVARFHPQKDHHNFALAAARLLTKHPDTHFLLCGLGIDSANDHLCGWIRESGAADHFHLLGPRDDIPRLTAALDLATTAGAEAFPLVIGEAMACGVPCVVTDIGDSAFLVGDTGLVVPPKNPAELARAWAAILDMELEPRTALGLAARRRIQENFALPLIARRYQDLHEEIVTNVRSRRLH